MIREGSLLTKNECLEVYLINCDQQPNMNDCGLYAIANATEFLSEDGSPMSIYDITWMRQHLVVFRKWCDVTVSKSQ